MKSIKAAPIRQRLPESERREQILRAALHVARHGGLAAVTARNVAKEAGLSQGLVFFHFGTTDDLLGALVTHLVEASLRAGPKLEAYSDLPATEQLPAFLTARLESLDQARERHVIDLLVEAWVAGLHAPHARESVREAASQYREDFLPIARIAIAAEPARFKGVTPEALATMVLSLVLGTAVQAAVQPELWNKQSIGAAVRALLAPSR